MMNESKNETYSNDQTANASFGTETTAQHEFGTEPTAQYEFVAEETAQFDPVSEGQQSSEYASEPKPKERWHEKVGRSVGAKVGIAACSLLLVAAASGVSAFAGTQLALNDDGPKASHSQQGFQDRSFQGEDGYGLKGGNGMRSFDQGTMPDSGLPGTDGQDNGFGKQGRDGMEAPEGMPDSGELRDNGSSDGKDNGSSDRNGNSNRSGNADTSKKGSADTASQTA